jgi:hypothetical protein
MSFVQGLLHGWMVGLGLALILNGVKIDDSLEILTGTILIALGLQTVLR